MTSGIIKGNITPFTIGGQVQYMCEIKMPRITHSCIGMNRVDALNRAWKRVGLLTETKS